MQGSISKQIGFIIVFVLTVSLTLVFFIMLMRAESTMMHSAENNVKDVNRLINNSIIFAMDEGASSVEPYFNMMENIPEIRDLRLIPSNRLRDDNSEAQMDAVEKKVFKEQKENFFYEDFNDEDVIRGVRTIDAKESCLDCHEVGLNDPLAVLSVRYSIEEVHSSIASQRISAILGALVTIIFAFFLIRFMINRKVMGRLLKFIENIKILSTGDLKTDISCVGNDELTLAGQTLLSLQQATTNKVQIADAIAGGDLTDEIQKSASSSILSERDQLSKSLDEMVRRLRTLFSEISDNSGTLSQTSQFLNDLTKTILSESEVMDQRSAQVTSASQNMNTNIDSISVATEQMSSTVAEIAESTEKTRKITSDAVSLATETGNKMNALNSSAAEISQVVQIIEEIADQTKLLALNATIEAARAGEAGKGFAVVAGEVKDLAQQTNQATEDIRHKIDAIQSSTGDAVKEIQQISKIINEINDLVAMIATAVEEQNVTTSNIADNIGRTAHLSSEVVNDIAALNQAVSGMKDASSKANQSAATVAHAGDDLDKIVHKVKL